MLTNNLHPAAELATALTVLDREVANARREIAYFADQGDTLACDIRHGRIDTLEAAMAIIAGEVA